MNDSKPIEILYQDDFLVVIDKPEGMHVHPPEDRRIKVNPDDTCIRILPKLIGKKIYPIHRLDSATSGCLVFALSSESASKINKQFAQKTIKKQYLAVTRGWIKSQIQIDLDLESDSSDKLLPSLTEINPICRIELPFPIGKRYPTARYTLASAVPITGRYRQIRRHLNRVSHPILGDHDHGDHFHNQFFRDQLKLPGLFLRSVLFEFQHPISDSPIKIQTENVDSIEKCVCTGRGQLGTETSNRIDSDFFGVSTPKKWISLFELFKNSNQF